MSFCAAKDGTHLGKKAAWSVTSQVHQALLSVIYISISDIQSLICSRTCKSVNDVVLSRE